MTILHVTHEMSRASGVATFVRELARPSLDRFARTEQVWYNVLDFF